eukprot:TRINITY_DN61177_c0_g1_i1.p1 TRINITY_DN61177_c0_g1~~TRINITY_DN61177_c0_g1_i1.p1  ORF type:complete len:241 (-),score=22.91 TRINITY_DN61177_c0_g1_i1:97-819(-)
MATARPISASGVPYRWPGVNLHDHRPYRWGGVRMNGALLQKDADDSGASPGPSKSRFDSDAMAPTVVYPGYGSIMFRNIAGSDKAESAKQAAEDFAERSGVSVDQFMAQMRALNSHDRHQEIQKLPPSAQQSLLKQLSLKQGGQATTPRRPSSAKRGQATTPRHPSSSKPRPRSAGPTRFAGPSYIPHVIGGIPGKYPKTIVRNEWEPSSGEISQVAKDYAVTFNVRRAYQWNDATTMCR